MSLFVLFRIQNVTLIFNMKGNNNVVCAFVGSELNFSYVIPVCCRTRLNSLFSDGTTDDKRYSEFNITDYGQSNKPQSRTIKKNLLQSCQVCLYEYK